VRWNECKYRVFKIMQYRREKHIDGLINPYQLSRLTGVGIESLLGLLPRWERWRYISRVRLKGKKQRKVRFSGGQIIFIRYSYRHLLFKGEHWCSWFESRHADLADEYFSGLQKHLDSLGPLTPATTLC
jgi:hypothetical protein